MNCRAPLLVESLALLIVITGCGGGYSQSDRLNKVTVTVSPAGAVTIPPGGEVTLHAMVTGSSRHSVALFGASPDYQTNGASGARCNWSDTTPPAGPCPDGTIQGEDTSPLSVTVTYHAPSTSGTFHVIAEWSTAFTPAVVRDGTSVITVQ